jgi:predicted Zn-dependent protease
MTRKALALLLAVFVAVGCASTNLPPIGSTGANFAPEEDEQRLWMAARQAEDKIVPPTAVYEDGSLQAYVDQVVQRLTPASYVAARGEPIRVRVRKDPRLNASALSHGTVVVHTGLIARAENEAQLAGVLAHEIGHVTHRHHVRQARAIENRRVAANVAGLLAMLAVTAAAVDQANRGNYGTADALVQAAPPLLTLGLNLSFAAMVSGYSRDLEREADDEGMRLMARAGYDPREMGAAFRAMLAESGNRGAIETFFWGSHPRLTERIDTVDRRAREYGVSVRAPIALGADFDRRLQRVRVSNAQYDAYMGRMTLARAQIAKATASVPSALHGVAEEFFGGLMLHGAARGALFRLKDEALAHDLLGSAAASLRRAAVLAPASSSAAADVHKTLGLMLHDWPAGGTRYHCDSRRALERYLELRPAASDADTIRSRVRDLRC